MEHVSNQIRNRRSIRSFDGHPLRAEDLNKLRVFMDKIENPYGIPVKFQLLSAKDHGLVCPVVSDADLYVGGKIKHGENSDVAFGYSFESLVLYAQSLGVGTVWLGGTMNRTVFEKAMVLEEGETMPCASPLGYPAEKMSLREKMMRKAIKADERLPFDELFFHEAFDNPLTKKDAGALAHPLEMVRLAPSAMNKQPWRVILTGNTAHFYLKRSKGFARHASLDMQMVDMGIALCHFALSVEECGLELHFLIADPHLATDTEYIASYQIL